MRRFGPLPPKFAREPGRPMLRRATDQVRGIPSQLRRLPLLLILVSAPVWARGLAVTIADQNGQPVPQAVVILQQETGSERQTPSKGDARPAVTIDQVGETFVPGLQIAPLGGSVLFHNGDRFRHHVYSFSPARTFEFVLAPGETSQPVNLPNAGLVTIGCNIHDHMIAYLYVTDARWREVTGPAGEAVFADLPDGAYTVEIFHPRQRQAVSPRDAQVTPGARAELGFTMSLLPEHQRRRGSGSTRY